MGLLESCRLAGQHWGAILEVMITYKLTIDVVTQSAALFKQLGSKPTVVHMAVDVELHENSGRPGKRPDSLHL